jgi:hypothetical protein
VLAKRFMLNTARLVQITRPPINGLAHPGRRCNDAPAISTLAALLLLCPAGLALAQTGAPPLWTTNGTVYAVVRDGGTIYIGGNFTKVGRTTGSCAGIDASTGTPQGPYAGVIGKVYAIAPDGNGGWYLGGSFTAVRGQPRNNLAQLDAAGNLTAWDPDVRGPFGDPGVGVYALAVSGGTVFVGGWFFSIHGQGRNCLAALDATTGAPASWTRYPNGVVNALAVSGSTIYAGGSFTAIGGQPRNYIAALDMASGLATPWNPSANHPVGTLAVNGGTVYAGGNFTTIGGQPRNYVAALDATSGAATPWDPNASNSVTTLAVSGATVYAGGCFTTIGGQPRSYVAALDAVSGAASAWNASPDSCVSALAVNGSTVYVAGRFTSIGGQPRSNLAALDAASAAVTAWNPNPDREVSALAVNGSTVYAGGSFTSVGWLLRNGLAALDAATGAFTGWNPNPRDSYPVNPTPARVYALAVSNGTVYVGGQFTDIGGCDDCYGLVGLDAVSGEATWSSAASLEDQDNDPHVGPSALAVSGGTVYVGGNFVWAGGYRREYLAALDVASGAVTAWNPGASSSHIALAVSGSTIYVGDGRVRAIDAADGATNIWSVSTDGAVAALAVSGGTVYAGGYFGSIGGQPRSGIAALDAISGAATTWNPNAQGQIDALTVNGGTVYAGGYFTSIGGQPRNNIAALDAVTGVATALNPNADDRVLALAASDGAVYLGGQFHHVGGQLSPGIAAISVDTPTATLLAQFDATPTADGIELRWSFGEPSRVAAVAVERAPEATGPWTSIDPEVQVESGVTVALDLTADDGGEYFYRLVVQLTDGSPMVFGPVSANRDESIPMRGLILKSPNPTPGGIKVQYAVARAGQVRLELVDVSGRVVATLADRTQEAGRYEITWDGASPAGQIAPGLYFVRLMTPDRVTVRKLAVVR